MYQPKLIGINEVLPKNFTDPIHKEEFEIEGFDMLPHPNVISNVGRGSILYVHKSLNGKPVDFNELDSVFEEQVFAEINLTNNDKLLAGVMYRRDQGTDSNNDAMLKLFPHIAKADFTHNLLMGDYNFRNIDWCTMSTSSSDQKSLDNRFIDCVNECCFTQHITEPTRQRGDDIPTTLDLVFTNEENMIDKLEINAPLGKSDHSVITFDFVAETPPQAPKVQVLFDKGDYTKISAMLNEVNWEDEMKKFEGDVEAQWKFLKDIHDEAVKTYIPTKTLQVNGKRPKKFQIPYTEENLRKFKKKNKLWSRVRRGLADEEEKLHYKRLRNQIRSLTRKAKKKLEKHIAKQAKSNPKAFWQYSQQKLKTKTGIPDLLVDPKMEKSPNKVYTKNDQEKADVLQNFFSSVFTNEPPGTMPEFNTRDFESALTTVKITPDIVEKKLSCLKANKSPGPDKMHPRVLKSISKAICVPVSIIFNTSISTRTLPEEWKVGKISAIFKKGNKSSPGNYRPVSLTAILCKVLESIVRDEIVVHFKSNNLFSSKQFGFLSGRSTVFQLLKVLDIWTDILDQGGTLDMIYCDFMKAFDKVPHGRLVYKLQKYGVEGDLLGWISSFLSNRSQEVVVNNAKSKSAPVTSGIPQGSVLGPLLFVVYINDLPDIVDKDTFIYLFADDTKAFRLIRGHEDRVQLQKDINKMVEWSKTWLLKFHPEKCKMMHIGKYEITGDEPVPEKRAGIVKFIYNMEEHPLEYTKCEKDLGVQVDDKLNFESHIYYSIKKANRVWFVVRRTLDYMDEESFALIFKGLVRPHLEYAAPVWSPHGHGHGKHIDDIEKVQRRATKTIPGFKDLEYNERLRKLDLPTLAYRRVRGDMIQVFKMLHEDPKVSYDKEIPEFLVRTVKAHDISTRAGSDPKSLYTPRFNTPIRQHSFSQRVIHIWNDLPADAKNAKSVVEFEKILDNFWENQPLKYDNHKADIILQKQPARFLN